MQSNYISHDVGWKAKCQSLERVWQFLIKLNKHLSNDPEIPLPDIYSREVKIYIYTKFGCGIL